MAETSIQIVSFNIPYPPDYGGVIDIFYKIKALSETGISVYLHCFEYNRPQAAELEKYCTKIFYYPRKTGIRQHMSYKPYISISRTNNQLIKNLSDNKSAILFEGLHSCYYLNHPALSGHLRLVRTHNIEHDYYFSLSKAELNPFKKLFFRIESIKLSAFEETLKNAAHLLCISPNDNYWFDHKFGNSHFIPAFHPFDQITSKVGHGEYILFHGNLSVSENLQAVDYLIKNIAPNISHQLIVAGKNPSNQLIQKIKKQPNIKLIANPEQDQMESLIQQAHICLLPTFQDTGLKLKLLASLFSGRFCIANSPMIHKTGLEHLCHLANTPEEMIAMINDLFEQDFNQEEIEKRKLILEDVFSNEKNAEHIKQLIQKTQQIDLPAG